jgi:hypothetical protein
MSATDLLGGDSATAPARIVGEAGQFLQRSGAKSAFELDPARKEEALELLAQGMATYEALVQSLAFAQASGEAARAQLDVVSKSSSDAASSEDISGELQPPQAAHAPSSALERARAANTSQIAALRTQLEAAQEAAKAAKRDLEAERQLRAAAEAKAADMVSTSTSNVGASSSTERGAKTPEPLPPLEVGMDEQSESARNSDYFSPKSPSVEDQLEQMHLDVKQQLGEPKTAGQFVQSAVAGALAGTAKNAVKLMNNMISRSPSQTSAPSPERPFDVTKTSSSEEPNEPPS